MFHTLKEIGEPQHSGVAHQILVSIHQRLSQPGVWTKGTPGPGKACLSTAIAVECMRRGLNHFVCDLMHRHVMKAIGIQGGMTPMPTTSNWIPGWNDMERTTLAHVLEVLTIAAISANDIEAEVAAQIGVYQPTSERDLMMMAAPSGPSIESPSIVYGCAPGGQAFAMGEMVTLDYTAPPPSYAQKFVDALTHAW